MSESDTTVKLTREALNALADKGFRYVLIKAYSVQRQQDYIQMNHFTLVPVRELPRNQEEKEIFAPIDSDILLAWADSTDKDLKAYIEIG